MNLDDSSADAGPGHLGVGLRGVLMGIAEVVPGVSGGTIAFVTGIYPPLVKSFASFGLQSLKLLSAPRRFIEHHNLSFLVALAVGMGLGIALFAQLMQYLLANHQPLVWAFFSGVILMSVWVIGRARLPRALLFWAPFGLLCGLALLWLPQADGTPGYLALLLGASVAVCAWLLPAVSGSYVLLTLGLYAPVISALAEWHIPVLATVAVGCAIGLLCFSKLLAWLLRHYSEPLLSFLTGFMLGSVVKLWPWQHAGAETAWARLLTPAEFASLTGAPAGVVWVGVLTLVGAAGLWWLSRFSPE